MPHHYRIYQKIAEDLEARSSLHPAGTPLPPVPVLKEKYGVSQRTVSKALAILKARGRVVYRAGLGNFFSKKGGSLLRRIALFAPLRFSHPTSMRRVIAFINGVLSYARGHRTEVLLFEDSHVASVNWALKRLCTQRAHRVDAIIFQPYLGKIAPSFHKKLVGQVRVIMPRPHPKSRYCIVDYSEKEMVSHLAPLLPFFETVYLISFDQPLHSWRVKRERHFLAQCGGKGKILRAPMQPQWYRHEPQWETGVTKFLRSQRGVCDFPALFVGIDEPTSVATLHWLQQEHLSIPKEASLIGLDCQSQKSRDLLAHVYCSPFRRGWQACRLALRDDLDLKKGQCVSWRLKSRWVAGITCIDPGRSARGGGACIG